MAAMVLEAIGGRKKIMAAVAMLTRICPDVTKRSCKIISNSQLQVKFVLNERQGNKNKKLMRLPADASSLKINKCVSVANTQ